MDEATANLDFATESAILDFLKERLQGTTKITIAHRIQTVLNSDFVLVMEGGRVAEFGKPKDLLEQGGQFKELVNLAGS